MNISTRIINIFENYLKIKYNKDKKDIILYKMNDIIMVFYKENKIITLYSLLHYTITKNNKIYKEYNNFVNFVNYNNCKNNYIYINNNTNIKNISCNKINYNLEKTYYTNMLTRKSYYSGFAIVHILLCDYIYCIYNIYIYYNKKKLKKLYKYIYYYTFNYKIIFIIFGLFKL